MEHLFPYPKMGTSFLEILHDQLTRKVLGFDAVNAEKTPFISGVSSRLNFLLNDPMKHLSFLKIGYTALEAFLQANCTGPPLDFNPEDSIFPETYRDERSALKQKLLRNLSVDGNAVYPLTPHIELFWLAKLIMSNSVLADVGFNGRRGRFRANIWHQKLLSEKSDALKNTIYKDAGILEQQLSSRLTFGGAAAEEHFVEFLVERAQVRIFYGDDDKAREDLARASKTRHFYFALTGALGKRTKFQVDDLSQLVVLARSRDHEPEPYSSRKSSRAEGMDSRKGSRGEIRPRSRTPSITTDHHRSPDLSIRPHTPTSPRWEHHVSPLSTVPLKPHSIPLNDDTLLEHIKFKEAAPFEPDMTHISDESSLPTRLTDLDPANQPLLFPMDSVILLATASSIENTSPSDGLTREETLPYATRVLEGGSSNWQVYTQALLVRSRIEGYKSRTVERGLLQLQALVDQVIAETSASSPQPPKASGTATSAPSADTHDTAPTTFLPRPRSASDSASVAERLRFIYQLSPPMRWELEAELAARWTSLGGLKSALEIYERLQMHAETALCLAATDKEAEAEKLLRSLLFVDTGDEGGEKFIAKEGLPTDAPRLLCILGDIVSSPIYYSLAWQVSNQTYSRAQRSLGRHFVKTRDYSAAAEAYKLALERSRLDHATWFALGCVQLEIMEWENAAQSFTRCVLLDDGDAEGWSNFAVALLRLPVTEEQLIEEAEDQAVTDETPSGSPGAEIAKATISRGDPYKHKHEALRALRRAATLKRDDPRIWDNYLTVAASIPPSSGTPWSDIIQAMQRVVELRGQKGGESSIDLRILEVLVNYITGEYEFPTGDIESSEVLSGEATMEEPRSPEEVAEQEAAKQIEGDDDVGPTDHPHSSTTAPVPDLSTVPEGDGIEPFPSLPAEPKRLHPHIRFFLALIDKHIAPLATSSPALYRLLARVAVWRHRPREALEYHEKAWRATTGKPDAYATEQNWKDVVASTKELAEKYEELGEMERERTGGIVEKGWRFKARSAVRGVVGRGREAGWEGSEGMGGLLDLMEGLKGDGGGGGKA